ncbi:MAG: hypothetical protein V7731_18855 [Amphritea sp.]
MGTLIESQGLVNAILIAATAVIVSMILTVFVLNKKANPQRSATAELLAD